MKADNKKEKLSSDLENATTIGYSQKQDEKEKKKIFFKN